MDRGAIARQLREIVAGNLETSVPEELREEDRLNEDLNLDSIMVLQLAVYVEETFEVSIPEEEVDPAVFRTVGALIDFINRLQSAEVGKP